jgi:hypothetical protein
MLGVDGGAMFQIIALEDLGLGPRAIGIAFAMGAVSVPIQLAAARLPLWRARSHLQAFLVAAAILCWVLAVLVALDVAGEPVALVALGVTVVAEINVSVLYAPAWQPLLKYALTSEDRQTVNSRGRAAGGVLLAATLIVFGAAGGAGRASLLVLVGAVGLLLAGTLRHLPAPARPTRGDADDPPVGRRPPLPQTMRLIYVVLALAALTATWPLFIVYAREVLWPTVNLGILGAIQLGGSLLAAATWRPTRADLTPRALRASGLLVAAAVALAVVRAPVSSRAEEVATVVAFATAAAATTTIFLVLMERAHRAVDDDTSVRALTVFDVVASTSHQIALLIGGFLVSASVDHADWLLDPYRIYLLTGTWAVALALAAPSLRRPRGRPPGSAGDHEAPVSGAGGAGRRPRG